MPKPDELESKYTYIEVVIEDEPDGEDGADPQGGDDGSQTGTDEDAGDEEGQSGTQNGDN